MYHFNTRDLKWLEENDSLVTFDLFFLLYTKDPPGILHRTFLEILNAPVEETVRVRRQASGEALGVLYRLYVIVNSSPPDKDLGFNLFSQGRDFIRGFGFVSYFIHHNRFYSFIVEGVYRPFFMDKLKLRPVEQNYV